MTWRTTSGTQPRHTAGEYKTEKPVPDYFGDTEAHVQKVGQCLASMYQEDSEFANHVTVKEEHGMAYPEGFSSELPNIVDYMDISGKTIKLDNAGGYTPTAQAPLIIRVEQGTATIGKLGFEGWSSGADAQQSYARYIMLDLKDAAAKVTIDGLEMGALWAPQSALNFNSNVTTNGQWFAGSDVSTDGGGEVHHHTFKGLLTCGETDAATGTFHLQKRLSGIEGSDFPEGTTFPVTATWDGGEETFALPADGTEVPSGLNLPVGTVVTLTEGDLPDAPEGYEFVSKSLSSETIEILGGGNTNVVWTVTNKYGEVNTGADTGTFSMKKALSGIEADEFAKGTVFTVTASWEADGEKVKEEFKLPLDGSAVASGVELPVGTKVTFEEIKVPTVEGYTFKHVSFTQKTVEIEAGKTVQVTATNTYDKGETLAKTGASGVVVGAVTGLTLLTLGAGLLLLQRRREGNA